MSRWSVVAGVVAWSAVGSAGPLGQLWRTKIDPKHSPCINLVATSGALALSHDGKIELFDRATGKMTTLTIPALAPKPKSSPSINTLGGDLILVENYHGPMRGLDAKTGAVRWQRQASTKDGLLFLYTAGSDVIGLEEAPSRGKPIQLERFDAATGTTRWKVSVPSKHAMAANTLVTANRIYLIEHDDPKSDTITALDASGKLLWSVDDQLQFMVNTSTSGDDLIVFDHDNVHVYEAATGKLTTWTVPSNTGALLAGNTVYALHVSEVVAHDALTGKPRWKTKLPEHENIGQSVYLVGAAGGTLYVQDDDVLYEIDAASGKLGTGFGLGGGTDLRVRDGAPAITMCEGKHLVALDPSVPADEHHLEISGKLRCKNCESTTTLAVRIGTVSVEPSKSGRFSIEATARGTMSLWVKDSNFPAATAAKQIVFDHDGKLKLGDIPVTVPEMGPDED
jgi:outer membrane protein assembly factor BamB